MNGSIIVTRNTPNNPGLTMQIVAIHRDITTYSAGVQMERGINAADPSVTTYRMPASAVNDWLRGNGFDPEQVSL